MGCAHCPTQTTWEVALLLLLSPLDHSSADILPCDHPGPTQKGTTQITWLPRISDPFVEKKAGQAGHGGKSCKHGGKEAAPHPGQAGVRKREDPAHTDWRRSFLPGSPLRSLWPVNNETGGGGGGRRGGTEANPANTEARRQPAFGESPPLAIPQAMACGQGSWLAPSSPLGPLIVQPQWLT
jgi:hypothetical protein